MSKWDAVALTDDDFDNADHNRWSSVALEEDEAPTTLSEELDPERGSYWVDQLKRGMMDVMDTFLPDPYSMGEGIGESKIPEMLNLAIPGPSLPRNLIPSIFGIDVDDYRKEDGEVDMAQVNAAVRSKKDAIGAKYLGYQGLEPETSNERMFGPAARAAGDPISYIGGGGTTLARKGIQAGVELAASMGASVVGMSTAQVARDIVENFGVEDEAALQMAQIFGGVLGGAGAGVARVPLTYATQTAESIYRSRRGIGEKAEKANDYIATSAILRNIEEAQVVQPKMSSIIETAAKLENEVPGLIMPPFAVLADNPVYRKNIETLLRTRPEFFAKAKASLDDSLKALDDFKISQYGVGGAKGDELIRQSLPLEYGRKIAAAQKSLDDLDVQLTKQTDRIAAGRDVEEVGTATQTLMTSKAKAVQNSLSPRYEAAIKQAENAGVTVAPRDAFTLNESIQELFQRGKFDDFPDLAREVRSKWSQEYLGSPDVQKNGVSIRDLDSLKRAVNKSLRQTKDPDKRRTLGFLKDQVKILSDSTGSFGKKIAELDLEFYERLGVPRSQAGIQQLDAARFSTQAGAYLAKPEQARDFLGFVGEAGIPVVKDSILIRANAAALRPDGSVNTNGLAKFIRNNEALIDMVPGLRGELDDVGSTINTLNDTFSQVQANHTKYAKKNTDSFYKAFHNKNLSGVVNDMIGSPRRAVEYFDDIKQFTPETQKMVKQAVRSEFIEKGMDSSQSMMSFLQQNKAVVDTWFGKDYIENVEKMAQISDILQKVDIDKIKFSIDFSKEDLAEKTFGISSSQMQSVLRDRISGWLTKLAIVASKISTSKVSEKRDNGLMGLLLDPKALEDIKALADQHKLSALNIPVSGLQQIGQRTSIMALKGAYFGTKNGTKNGGAGTFHMEH